MKHRLIALILTLALCAALLCGCGQGAGSNSSSTSGAGSSTGGSSNTTPTQPETGSGEMQLSFNSMQISADSMFECPYIEKSYWASMLFDTPISVNADGTIVYKLASDVQVSDDGLTYTFTMRDGVKWTDGEPVTGEDLAFSMWYILADPEANYGNGFTYVEGADKVKEGAKSLSGVTVDGNTVTVQLYTPYSLFLNFMASYLSVLPSHCFEGVAAEDLDTYEAYWSDPIGCGAYHISEKSLPDYFVMERSDDYYREPAGIQRVRFTNYATGGDDAMVAALIAGTLDVGAGGGLNDNATMENVTSQNSDVTSVIGTSNYTRMIMINVAGPDETLGDGNGHPGMKDVRVRQAINMLIDKEALAGFFGDQAVVATTHVHSDSKDYNADIPAFQRDVEGAKALLEEANFDFDHVVRIAYAYTDQITPDIVQVIKQNLEEVGMTVEVTHLQGDLGTQIYDVRNYDIYYGAEMMDDVVDLYRVLMGVDGYFDSILGDNEIRQKLFNEPIEEYYATSDPARQHELLCELQQNQMDSMYIIPLYGLDTITAYNAAHIQIPQGLYDIDVQSKDMCWEDWKLVG